MPWLESMSAGDGVTGLTQVFRQIHFHLGRCFERHGVQMHIQFGQELNAITFYERRRLDPGFVVGEPFLWRQSCHSDIDTRLFRITPGILGKDFPKFGDSRFQLNNVDMMVLIRFLPGTQLVVCSTLHRS